MSDALVKQAKEVVKTASRCWGVCAGATPDGYCLCEVSARAAIAAAINAWPGAALAQRIHPTIGPRRITLPLPQKEGDA